MKGDRELLRRLDRLERDILNMRLILIDRIKRDLSDDELKRLLRESMVVGGEDPPAFSGETALDYGRRVGVFSAED